jgi:hypothetical protein
MNTPRLKLKLPPSGGTAAPQLKLREGRSRLKLSSMPFAAINALSRSPELLRQCARLGLAVVLFAGVPGAGLAQDAPKAPGPDAPGERTERKSKSFFKRSEPRGETTSPAPPTNGGETAPAVSENKPAPPAPVTPSPRTSAKPEAAPSPRSYDAFRVITERNIFDGNRTARTRGRSSEEPPPAPKVESFALVGTMAYEKNSLAFFDSGNSAYRKTAKAGDTIGIHKLKKIGASQVTLEAEGKEVELKVGMQMRRENDGAWEAAVRAETFAAAPAPGGGGESGERRSSFGGGDPRSSRSSRGGSSRGPGDSRSGGPSPGSPGLAPSPSSPPPSGGGENAGNDLLRRLMEQRQKEINR